MPEGDPLVAPAVVPGNEPPPARRGKIRCEFCETELGGSGEFVKLSDRAKALRGLEEKNEALQAEIAKRDREITELKAKIPQPVLAGSGKKGLAW